MSYILDALKKLEQEKSRKNRGSGMVNISGALFEQEAPRKSSGAGWKVALAVTAAVLLTFGATWYLLQPGTGREKPAPRLATPPAAVAPARVDTPAAPPVPETVLPPSAPPATQAPAAVPTVTSAPATPAVSRPAARVPKAPAAAPVVTTAEDAAAQLTMQELRKRTIERQGPSPVPEQVMAPPADIKLSGIAWQDDRRARRAVVNGFLMQEGGVVAGARITDIFQDRVRFSLSGRSFEIPLDSAGFKAGR